MNALTRWKHDLHKLTRIGARRLTDRDLESYLIQTNTNGLVFFVFDLVLALSFYILGASYIAGLLMVSAGLFFVSSVGLNYFGFFNLARISTVSIGSLLVLGCAFYLGKDYLAHASLLLGGIFPFVYFRTRERWQIAICLAVSVLCYAALILTDYSFGPRMDQLGSTHEKIVEAIFMLVPFAGIVGNTFSAVARREAALAQLQASQEQVNGLFQVLSHDFSSPLLVAMIHSQRALETGSMEKKSVERIDSSLKKLERMLRNFRKLANVFVRKDEISVEPTAVATIIERVRANLTETLHSKNVEISYVPTSAGEGVTILVDPTVAESQIFQNLIHNAIKFSTPGSKVLVRITQVDDAMVTIEIEDSGTGIPPEKLSRLFSWTEKTTTLGTLGEVGTGFGLPIVRMCVEAVGGTIAVTSRHQKAVTHIQHGTTFTLKFRRGASLAVQSKPDEDFQRAI